MHIAVVSLGAFGHVNPTLELVTELVRRGVRVTYFCTEGFRTIVEPTGAQFVAVPSWWKHMPVNPGRTSQMWLPLCRFCSCMKRRPIWNRCWRC